MIGLSLWLLWSLLLMGLARPGCRPLATRVAARGWLRGTEGEVRALAESVVWL